MAKAQTPKAQLASFMAKYTPEIAAEGKIALATLRKLVPGATELVYDNYNFLVVGFGPSERASDAVLSLVFAPRWLSVSFLQNASKFKDPHKLLRGAGNKIRNVRLESAADLGSPAVGDLIAQALALAPVPVDRKARGKLIIRSISAKQKPRRPAS
jgi:hypothetical protein